METEKGIDWTQYAKCPKCKAAPGDPCEHMVLLTTKGKPVYLDTPHPKRPKRK